MLCDVKFGIGEINCWVVLLELEFIDYLKVDYFFNGG